MKNWLMVFLFLNSVLISAQTVYKTPSGTKYHTATCSSIKNVSHKISLQEAKRKGLTACKICHPDSSESSARSSSGNKGYGIKSGEATGTSERAVQCKGYTKSGARCKRTTKNKNEYCFQHEP